MRILLVKTSSLGDVIHNLPVVADIRRHWPDAIIDWCVEESFAAIPRLHPAVGKIIPVAIRRWRKNLFRRATWSEMAAFRRDLRSTCYDWVIDTQGLAKSALLTGQAIGQRAGYAADSAREPLAARFYQTHQQVPTQAHAVERNRRLVAQTLGYDLVTPPDYGLGEPAALPGGPAGPYVMLLSATSRDDKLWPEAHWIELGLALHAQGLRAVLPGGGPHERVRAARLAAAIPEALAAPPLSLPELAAWLGHARAVVGVDTGLTHLAVALGRPTVALYTATDPGLTGVYGTTFHRNLGGRNCVPAVPEVLAALSQAPA